MQQHVTIMKMQLMMMDSCILPVGCDTCSGETDGTGVVVNNDADGDGVCDADEVFGCTDPLYEEYDPLATEDDGSCSVLSLDGCTDPTACNYNENATDDNGSCILPVGCDTCSGETDGTGVVVNNDADGDGVCDADEVAGCQDATACNYNENATDDDGSCILPVGCDTCSGETDGTGVVVNNDADGDGVCDADEVFGCTDPLYIEFNSLATEDDGSCLTLIVNGCTDVNAFNYNPAANVDDNSCIYEGCTDPSACNFNPVASIDDSSCLYPLDIYGFDYVDCNGICLNDADGDGICDEDEVGGCTDPDAYNYDETADADDGSCLYLGCNDVTACNFDAGADIDDGSCQYPVDIYGFDYVDCDGNCLNDTDNDGVCDEDEIWGCTDPTADNYNNEATQEDGSCEYLGCTDISACNYDLTANVDDGSCEFPIDIYGIDYVDCNGNCINDLDNNGICDEEEIGGCTDVEACNYDPGATLDDGSCIYPDEVYLDCNGDCLNDYDGDGICDEIDNCFYVYNPNQQDSDNDGEGDECDPDDGIGIEEVENGLLIYPNPTSGLVNLEYLNGDNSNVILKVINSVGQTIIFDNLSSNESVVSTTIDLSEYSKGIYQLQIIDSNQLFTNTIFVD